MRSLAAERSGESLSFESWAALRKAIGDGELAVARIHYNGLAPLILLLSRSLSFIPLFLTYSLYEREKS